MGIFNKKNGSNPRKLLNKYESTHARVQRRDRGIPVERCNRVLVKPDKVVNKGDGHLVAYKKVDDRKSLMAAICIGGAVLTGGAAVVAEVAALGIPLGVLMIVKTWHYISNHRVPK